jgi:hypothetical protein
LRGVEIPELLDPAGLDRAAIRARWDDFERTIRD